MVKCRHWASTAAMAILVLAAAACSPEPEKPRATANPPLAKHVLIVSIDGCRPDVLLRAELEATQRGEHPIIAQLMSEGSFTMWAQTIPASITLPSHTSMLTGVSEEVHGIHWNAVDAAKPMIYPNVPTLFDIAKQHGLTTSIFASKYKFHTFCKPGSIDWGYITPDNAWEPDGVMGEMVASVILEHQPNVIFMHLGTTDLVGHGNYPYAVRSAEGWGSETQMSAIELADQAIKTAVNALKKAGIYDQTLIIVTADHGGTGYWHGRDDVRAHNIPWICVGPDVRHNYDLARDRALWVHTEDTFATASYFLGLPIDQKVQGRCVTEVLQNQELAQSH